MIQSKTNLSGYKRLTIDQLSDDGCLNLLEAFLADVKDEFVLKYTEYINDPSSIFLSQRYRRLRRYILSQDFCLLTGLDGEYIVRSLETSVNARYKKWGVYHG